MLHADSSPALPPELIDTVIDYLHDVPKTLAACSLVARSWLACSHYHLFYQTLLGDDDFEVESDATEVIESSNSIRSNVRVLHIWSESISVAPSTLARTLDMFENLHTVRMYSITCKVTEGDSEPVQWARTRKLRKLELSGFDALRAEIVNTMVFFCRVPVGELLVSDWDVLPISMNQALSLSNDTLDNFLHDWHVDSVVFSQNVGSTALDLVRTACVAKDIRSIDGAEQACWDIPERFNQLLQDVGEHLTHLSLDVTGIYTQSCSSLTRAISQCTSLKSLHLYLGAHVFYDHFASVEVATAGFPLVLMSYIPSSIQHITLGFGLDYAGEFVKYWSEKVDWIGLERRLLSFDQLRSVRFVWEHPVPALFTESSMERVPIATRERIIKSLPRLYVAGKVDL